MVGDLNTPLGQDRRRGDGPAGSRRTGAARGWAGRLTLAAGIVALFGAAGYVAALSESALQTPPGRSASQPADGTVAAAGPDDALATGTVPAPAMPDEAAPEDTRQTALLSDGGRVTRITPLDRGGGGPVILSVDPGPSSGSDTRMAHLPEPGLLQETAAGRLPVRAADGRRPVDAYARPWSGAGGTRVAIVVGGLGLSQTGTLEAIEALPGGVTLAFAADGNSLARWMQEARRGGHEILMQVAFEPFDYPRVDPGPRTLTVAAGPKANLATLHGAMARITNYTGIVNFMGGRFLADPGALEPVMRDLSERGLLFLDDGTAAQSRASALAATHGVPFARADLTLDPTVEPQAIEERLERLERIARRNGQAVAVASAFPETVAAVARWAERAERRGIELVGISALADDPQDR